MEIGKIWKCATFYISGEILCVDTVNDICMIETNLEEEVLDVDISGLSKKDYELLKIAQKDNYYVTLTGRIRPDKFIATKLFKIDTEGKK